MLRFLVLGLVPGTSIQLNLGVILLMLLIALLFAEIILRLGRTPKYEPKDQNEDLSLIAL